MRNQPNIIVTGTPGTGKTTHCELLAQNTKLKHLSINQIAKDHNCLDGWDDKLETSIVDEDKLLDAIEPDLEAGGNIIDWHACDLFPERLIDLVVVLRTDSETLYDRLEARGYADKKLENNIDAEIMQVLLEEARESYDEQIVVELQSNTAEQIEANCERVEQWLDVWRKDHADAEEEK